MSSTGSETVAVVIGGDPIDPAVASRLGTFDLVIAADSGLQAADGIGLHVDVVVGDLDSVDPRSLDRAGLTVDRHPRAKDCTDIVLALDHAVAAGARRIVVVSGGGGRLDHQIANLLVLAAPAYAAIDVRAVIGAADVAVVRDRYTMSASPGRVVSLFAVGGPARGVTTDGLRYPLSGETLETLSSRGVSNECIGGPVTVTVDDGTLLVVRPGGEARDTRGEDRREATGGRRAGRATDSTHPTAPVTQPTE